MAKRKDPIAVALGKRGGKARWKSSTKAQRVAAAKHAATFRWPNGRAAGAYAEKPV